MADSPERCGPGRRLIAVSVVVHEGMVLVGRRDEAAADAAGCHEFPGGKVEPGETAEAAAARECLEETGVAVRIGRRLDAVSAPSRAGPVEVVFFAASPAGDGGRDRPSPLAPFAWTPLADLPRLSFPPANAVVLAQLAARQGGS